MPRTFRKPRAQPNESDLPSSRDFERHLLAKAGEVAPSDVTALVARAEEIGRRVATDTKHAPLAHHVRVALDLLSDHARGACPHIPYHTVNVLTAALHYYLEPLDVIPDFIPRFGKADDAHVFDIAWRLGEPGIERYVAWKGFTQPDSPRARAAIVASPPKPERTSTSRSRRGRTRRPVRRQRRR
jgi:uncharacterized membrane protein YkvA (DUF1232 family)